MMKGKIDLIVDLQYGSTGKGLLAGYLAETYRPDGVATCNMPNAGHTYIDKAGNEMIHKVLPNGVVSDRLKFVFIGPGAVFDPERLWLEIDQCRKLGYMKDSTVVVHPNAVILADSHRKMEQETLSGIASTMQGSAAASMQKMGRCGDHLCTAKHVLHVPSDYAGSVIIAEHNMWMALINSCDHILAEGSQGFSLGINQRFYPYCTSRECTSYRLLSDMGLPQVKVTTWGTLRTYPIRVGNTPDGFSGGVHYDQSELTWEDLERVPEKTTVTQRVRRVFTFSREQLDEALWHCRPNHLFLNFCNYMEPTPLGELIDDINEIANYYGTAIRLCGYGPTYKDVKPFNSRQIKGEFSDPMAHSADKENPVPS